MSFYEEKKIIDKFLGFIGNYSNNIIYHWSNAEPILMKKSLKRYNYDNKVNWCDLLKIFKEIPIVVKGSFSYGLKSIAKTKTANKKFAQAVKEVQQDVKKGETQGLMSKPEIEEEN